jgi:hypothetical protein
MATFLLGLIIGGLVGIVVGFFATLAILVYMFEKGYEWNRLTGRFECPGRNR